MKDTAILSQSKKLDLSYDKRLQDIMDWFICELKTLEYGELGFTLVIHQGKIVKIKQLKENSPINHVSQYKKFL
jgi:hypothetical protein